MMKRYLYLMLLLIFFTPIVFAIDDSNNGYHLPQFSQKIVPEFIERPIEYNQVLPKASNLIDLTDDKKRFFVKKIRIKNNTVLTRVTLLPIIETYVGKKVSMAQLYQLRFEINQLYIKEGFISSGVYLPDQKITDGTVIFNAIEGKLGDLEIAGNKNLSRQYFVTKFKRFFTSALNVNSLREKIEELKMHPSINHIHSVLEPGERTGLSTLKIRISEVTPFQLSLGVDNYRSPVIGSERLYIVGIHKNVTGYSDSLSAQVGITKGLKDYSVQYKIPFEKLNSAVALYFIQSDAQILESNQVDLDLESHSRLLGLKWSWKGASGLGYSGGYENSRSKIDGLPSICDSDGTGSDKTCALHIVVLDTFWNSSADYQKQNISFTVRKGLAAGYQEFTTINTLYDYSRSIKSINAMLRLDSKFQYAIDDIPDSEKMSLGGVSTVRGYRENTLVRDIGLRVSGEWIQALGYWNTYITTFIDYGLAWNKVSASNKEHLISVGGGLSWRGIKALNTEIFLGVPLLKRPVEYDNLQDYGLHLSLQYQVF